MYTTYFSLREMPFSITPDPAFLYMSPRHQEALGHLLYGTGQYGGFVQLTGEVGTGKTTVVRTLLAQKLPGVDVAVILNPRQNEHEFVQSICDELHVAYPKENATLKTLVDALNAHLLETHAQGRRTVLVIDEAQNLQPEVLEQVRLLTNLETHKEKLLRIMLVGQPELADLLARPDLRQLAQRITARYHLTPLSERETREYVAHRLQVAGGSMDPFTTRAVQQVHKYSRGVPRLINILCDRALLGAYGLGVKQVSLTIVKQAAAEVMGQLRPAIKTSTGFRRWALDAVLVVLILAVGAWWWLQPGTLITQPQAALPPPPEEPIAEPAPLPPADPKPAEASLDQLLHSAQPLPVVLGELIRLWHATPQIAAGESVCRALSRLKLECYKSNGEWKDLAQMNRPAILTLSSGRAGMQYALLRELDSDYALLDTAQGPQRFSLSQIDVLWTGEFLLLWPRETEGGIEKRGPAVRWLRQRLAEAEGKPLPPPVSETFDAQLRDALVRFQQTQGLDADGIVGSRTLIALSGLKPTPGAPTLVPAEAH